MATMRVLAAGPPPPTPLLLDLTAAVAVGAWSLRKLRAAYTGSAVRVISSNDAAEEDIGFDVNGNFDIGAVVTFLNAHGGTALIKTKYDQVGSADFTNADPSSQPDYQATGMNGLPTASFTSAFLKASGFTGYNGVQAVSVCAVVRRNGAQSFRRILGFGEPGQTDANGGANIIPMILSASGTDIAGYYAGAPAGILLPDVTPAAVATVWNGATLVAYVGNVGSTPDPAAVLSPLGATGLLGMGVNPNSTNDGLAVDIRISETVTFAQAIGSSDRTIIYNNQDAYWL